MNVASISEIEYVGVTLRVRVQSTTTTGPAANKGVDALSPTTCGKLLSGPDSLPRRYRAREGNGPRGKGGKGPGSVGGLAIGGVG